MIFLAILVLVASAILGLMYGRAYRKIHQRSEGRSLYAERISEASQTFSTSLRCLSGVDTGVVFLENILVIKIPGAVFSKIPLSREERRFLKKNLNLCDSPQELLDQMKKFGTPWVGKEKG